MNKVFIEGNSFGEAKNGEAKLASPFFECNRDTVTLPLQTPLRNLLLIFDKAEDIITKKQGAFYVRAHF